jgi:hypothetical protein
MHVSVRCFSPLWMFGCHWLHQTLYKAVQEDVCRERQLLVLYSPTMPRQHFGPTQDSNMYCSTENHDISLIKGFPRHTPLCLER